MVDKLSQLGKDAVGGVTKLGMTSRTAAVAAIVALVAIFAIAGLVVSGGGEDSKAVDLKGEQSGSTNELNQSISF